MKKGTIPFHPPLIALLPVLALLASNISMVPLSHATRPVLAAVCGAAILWGIFGLSFRSLEKGAMAATTFILVTLIFGFSLRQFNTAFTGWLLVLSWLIAGAGLGTVAGLKVPWTKAVNVVAAMTFLVALFQTLAGYAQARNYQPSGTTKSTAKSSITRPDIYYIILDGHGSDRSLSRVFGLPEKEGLGHQLEKIGFFVAHDSLSNYMQTELSVGSSMNFDYLQTLLPNADPNSQDRFSLQGLTDESRLGTMLKERGYEMIALRTSWFPPLEFSQADTTIMESTGLTFIESTLLELTPFGRSEFVATSQYNVHRNEIRGTFQNLKRLAGKAAAPRFIIAHVLCPHPPFVFGPHGEERRQPGPFGLWDGPDYRHYISTKQSYLDGYRDQVQYLDKMTRETVEAIISAPGEKPIVIVQGDHGSKAGLDAESPAKTDLDEVFSILNAYYVPDSIRERLAPNTSPVNSWRIVLSELFGEDLPELPVESYWSPYPYPMRLTRVTDKLKSSD